MRILFVTTNLPVPPTNGQAIRTLSIVQGLASLGHELRFISFAGGNRPKTLDPLPTYCYQIDLQERELTNMSQSASYWQRAACLLRGKPYSVERFRSASMQKVIGDRLQQDQFDLIVCDGVYPLVNVPDTDVPIVLNTHNVEYAIYERYRQVERNLLKKVYATLEARLMKGVEHRACQRARIVLACSQTDARTLQELQRDLCVFIVPNVVDTEFFYPTQTNEGGKWRPGVLFQGSMDWYPNRDAVEYFARIILPIIRAEVPGVEFVAAGRNPPADFVKGLAATGVHFTGTVSDMRPYLSSASLVVVPLRLGSGTRIKILEACASGKAVVSTTLGAEGLEMTDGREIIVADNPREFARSVIALLQDPERCRGVGESARAVIVERYSHAALKKSLKTAIDSLG